MKYLFTILLFFIAISINIFTLNDGHNWGDDFAQYIIHAQNIFGHKEFSSGIMLENPYSYPPGFSFLLLPLIKIFGVNFIFLKFINIIFWYLTILLTYKISKPKIGGYSAILVCLLLGFSSEFFTFKQNILSDIPFLFFITLGFYIFERYAYRHLGQVPQKSKFWFAIYLLIISLAFLIRSSGLIAFAATFFYLIGRKDWVKSLWALIALVISFYISTAITGIHSSFFNKIIHDPIQFSHRVAEGLSVPIRSLIWFFCPGQTVLTEKIFNTLNGAAILLTPILFLFITILLIRGVIKKDLSLSTTFCYFYLFPLIIWSGFESSPRAFARLILPIVIFILIGGIHFLSKKCRPIFIQGFLYILILLNLFNIHGIFYFNDDALFKKENQQLFEWVKKNTKNDEHYMFWQPRAMALMTGRVGTAPWTNDQNSQTSFIERVKNLNISYFILIKTVDLSLIINLENNPDFSKLVWENPSYKIFKIN